MNIAIISFGDNKVSQWNIFSFRVLTQYANLHGYDCHLYTNSLAPERPPAWSKILYLLKHLDSYDWVVWVDTDCIIEQVHRRIEAFISSQKDIVFCLGGDPYTLNSGVIIVKNTAWSKTYLQSVYQQEFLVNNRYLLPLKPEDYEKRLDCGCDGCQYFCYDQKAFIHILHVMDNAEVERHVEFRSTSDKEKCFQSYHDAYWVGCFIHHFPGNQESKNYIQFIESSRVALERIEMLFSSSLRASNLEVINEKDFKELPYDANIDHFKVFRYVGALPLGQQFNVYLAILRSFFFRLIKPRKRIGKYLSLKRIERYIVGKNNPR
ncbi:MAG: hypothetical protein ABGY96_06675 [bacterium]